jgi:hypothetical protein
MGGWGWGPGFDLAAGAFLREARLIEADPAAVACARLLTIELFLMRNLGSPMLCFDEPIVPMTLGNMRSLGV